MPARSARQTAPSVSPEATASRLIAVVRRLFALENDPAAALPVAQLKVCIRLYEAPRTLSVLSRELGVSLSAMTQLADRLERANLVKRVAGGTDRRVRRLQLTKRGHRIMHARETARVAQISAVLVKLPAPDRAAVDAALGLLLAASPPAKPLHAFQETLRVRST